MERFESIYKTRYNALIENDFGKKNKEFQLCSNNIKKSNIVESNIYNRNANEKTIVVGTWQKID